MRDWFQYLNDSAPRVKELHRQFLEMLQDGRHMFDAATGVLLSGGDPETIREDLFTTDQRINKTEQTLRREIVIHGTVFGTSSFPPLLVLMSITKDAERIGDYAKNIFGLARDGAKLQGEEGRGLVARKDTVSKMLARAHGLFDKQDEKNAATYLQEATEFQRNCDAELKALLQVTGRNTAGQVLFLRFLKRISSHAGNIVTSIIVPLEKLDFYPGRPESEQ